MNRLAIIYEYSAEAWSTPYSLMKEFHRRGWSVDRFHLSNGEYVSVLDKQYDVVIVMDWKGIDIPERIKNVLKNKGTYIVRENADTPQNHDKHIHCCGGYDLLLTPDYESYIKYKEAGFNCIQFQHFADTDIHKPYSKDQNYSPVRTTRGAGSSQLMDHLSQIMSEKFINRNGLVGDEYGEFLGGGLITFQHSRFGEITRRIFEGMACGTLIITDRLPKHTMIDSLFIENEDIVYYDDISSCISKINLYLCDEFKEERERISKNGYEKVMKYHTQVQRTDSIINEYNIWKESFRL